MHLEHIKAKITSRQELSNILARWRFKGYKVVFSNGVFDLLHRGHLEYLSKAADMGQKLVIGLNSDASVKRLKGPERPVQDEYTRAMILSALSFVDVVTLFEEDTPYELIKVIVPNVLVKGADYTPENIVGYDIVTQTGGEVRTVDLSEGFSTTATISRLKKL